MNNSRDELTGALVGLGATITEAMNEIEGFIPCGNPATITNAGLVILKNPTSEEKLAHQTEATKAFIEHVSEHRGVTAHDVADVSSFNGAKTELLSALSTVAMQLQTIEEHQPEIMEWVYRSLASLEQESNAEANSQLARYEEIQQQLDALSA